MAAPTDVCNGVTVNDLGPNMAAPTPRLVCLRRKTIDHLGDETLTDALAPMQGMHAKLISL